jgi:hypothetical protein
MHAFGLSKEFGYFTPLSGVPCRTAEGPGTPWSGPSAKLGPYAASRRVDVRGLGVAAHEAVSGWPKARPCGPPNFSGTSMCGCVWLAVVRRFLYSSCNAEREFGKPRTTPHRGFPFMQVQAPNVLRTLGGRLFCAAQRLPCIALGPLN